MTTPESEALRWHSGGCHCGAVRYETQAPEDIEVEDCNCSICSKSGYLHLIVPASRFRLLTPRSALLEYRFNTGCARHLFCAVCGVKSFYVPRSNPDGYSVNIRCLDDPRSFRTIRIVPFDGLSDWDAQASRLADRSKAT
ncbi:MAG: GFA family protein [Alphaproteobacteria bacterium]|nr:GFA family protein [Alphaproteobacteria bacterium]